MQANHMIIFTKSQQYSVNHFQSFSGGGHSLIRGTNNGIVCTNNVGCVISVELFANGISGIPHW